MWWVPWCPLMVCMSASLGVAVTVWCGGRFVKRLSDGKTAQSGVMVTHITVLVGRITELKPVRKARPSQLCGRCRSSMHDSDSPILFALTPMLFFLRLPAPASAFIFALRESIHCGVR
jgi:hypothetical protein